MSIYAHKDLLVRIVCIFFVSNVDEDLEALIQNLIIISRRTWVFYPI